MLKEETKQRGLLVFIFFLLYLHYTTRTFKAKHEFIYWCKLALFEPDCNAACRIALIISNIRPRWFLVTDVRNGAGLTRLKAASGVLLETPKPPCEFGFSCRFFQPAKNTASASAPHTS